jgi:hypothetical protein
VEAQSPSTPLPPLITIGPSANTATPLVGNPTPRTSPTVGPSLTNPPVTSIASATPSGPLTRPNGEVIHAQRLTIAPTLDGDLSEWAALPHTISHIIFQPAQWTGLTDNSAALAAGWDITYLYLAVRVTDDAHVQIQHGELLYRGDSLELQFDADLAGDFNAAQLSSDDFQLGLSPGNLVGDVPEAYLWNPRAQTGVPNGVLLAARAEGTGYTLEVAIPWTLYGVTPSGNATYGFALNSSDNDTPDTGEQQSMISTSPTRRLTDPTTWGTLMLDE